MFRKPDRPACFSFSPLSRVEAFSVLVDLVSRGLHKVVIGGTREGIAEIQGPTIERYRVWTLALQALQPEYETSSSLLRGVQVALVERVPVGIVEIEGYLQVGDFSNDHASIAEHANAYSAFS